MKNTLMSFTIAAMALILFVLPAMALDKPSVSVDMTAGKIIMGADGKESFESADGAKPGDVIEYRAVYQNTGTKKVANFKATIPVPDATVYVPGSAKPAGIIASTNGKDFAPVPLKKKVKLPSGKVETQDVPYSEYRSIRWDLKTLNPGKSVPVSIRVKLSTS